MLIGPPFFVPGPLLYCLSFRVVLTFIKVKFNCQMNQKNNANFSVTFDGNDADFFGNGLFYQCSG